MRTSEKVSHTYPHADLRNALPPEVKARIVLEINKDFTKHPVWEIERHIVASLAD